MRSLQRRYGNARGRRTATGEPDLPRIITHANMGPLLDAISRDPAYQMGPQALKLKPAAWIHTPVVLEVPTGELAKGGLNNLALLGHNRHESVELKGDERFNAQGLE